MSLEQIRVGADNFSYVIYCENSKVAALVDPGVDSSAALEFVRSQGMQLPYIINTHHHLDHMRDNKRVKQYYPSSEIVTSLLESALLIGGADRRVGDDDVIQLGEVKMEFIVTPGHSPGGLCIIVDDEALLTGDTLFIGDCGRTDLPGGSPKQLYDSLQRIKTLPDELVVYPGHDYGDKPYDTLGNQKRTNKALLADDLEEFKRIP